jgi:hypothetical protein
MSPARIWMIGIILISFSVWVGYQVDPNREPVGAYVFIFGIPTAILIAVFAILRKKRDDLQAFREEFAELKKRVDAIDNNLAGLISAGKNKTTTGTR